LGKSYVKVKTVKVVLIFKKVKTVKPEKHTVVTQEKSEIEIPGNPIWKSGKSSGNVEHTDFTNRRWRKNMLRLHISKVPQGRLKI
jgi:hypothetical protein